MARAYKCDRCGVLFDSETVEKYEGNAIVIKYPYNNNVFDLCPSCKKSLICWFKYFKQEDEKKAEPEV